MNTAHLLRRLSELTRDLLNMDTVEADLHLHLRICNDVLDSSLIEATLFPENMYVHSAVHLLGKSRERNILNTCF